MAENTGIRFDDVHGQLVADPNDPAYQPTVEFNVAALNYVRKLNDADAREAASRQTITIVIVIALALAGVGLIVLVVNRGTSNPGALAVVGLIVGMLLVALIVGPVQMFERDVVYRRWSDILSISFMLQAGVTRKSDREAILAATNAVSAAFGLLAAAHGKVANSSTDAIAAMLAAQATPKDDEDETKEPTVITVETPADPESTVGEKIADLVLVTSAPKDTTYVAEGLPVGIDFDGTTRTFTGTPSKAKVFKTKVTASSDSAGQALTVKFSWTVKAAPSEKPAAEQQAAATQSPPPDAQ